MIFVAVVAGLLGFVLGLFWMLAPFHNETHFDCDARYELMRQKMMRKIEEHERDIRGRDAIIQSLLKGQS